jgi:hypothetical protein
MCLALVAAEAGGLPMFDSGVLDVAIGLIFVFILVSTLCTAIREGIEAFLKTRSAYLEQVIRDLLDDGAGTKWAKHFFEHPRISALYLGKYAPGPDQTRPKILQRGTNLPSYLKAQSFALTVIDLVARGPVTSRAQSNEDSRQLSLEQLRKSVGQLENAGLRRVMLTALDSADGDLERVRHSLEDWYDDAMERASGWYKRSTQKVILGIAVLVVAALNVNTITISHHLYRDGALRDALVGAAERADPTAGTAQTVQQTIASLDALNLPVGWGSGWGAPLGHGQTGAPGKTRSWLYVWNYVIAPVFGLLMTVLAATLGAPFWFDILSRVMAIRSSIKPKEEPRTEPDGEQRGAVGTAKRDRAPAESTYDSDRDADGGGCDHADEIDSELVTDDEALPASSGGVMV